MLTNPEKTDILPERQIEINESKTFFGLNENKSAVCIFYFHFIEDRFKKIKRITFNISSKGEVHSPEIGSSTTELSTEQQEQLKHQALEMWQHALEIPEETIQHEIQSEPEIVEQKKDDDKQNIHIPDKNTAQECPRCGIIHDPRFPCSDFIL